MTGPKTVLHVINSLGISGGAEQQLVSNLQSFRDSRLRHVVAHLYSYEFGTRNAEIPPGVEVIPLRRVGERRGQLLSLHRLAGVVNRARPDLLHCSLAEAAVAARIVGRAKGIPVIESLVNISHESIRCVDNPHVNRWKLQAYALVDRATMRYVRHFQALSPAVSDSWQRVIGLPPNRISIIPRGVDIESIETAAIQGMDRDGLSSELDLPAGSFLLVAVGRHEAQKGQRYAIEAMPLVLAEVPDAVLLIVGREGNLTSFLKSMVKERGLDEKIRFLGRRRDVISIIAACDLFVFPSLFEGLGVALLEAMALGSTCVVSDTPPMNDTVRNLESGLVFETMSAESLAATVITAYRDPGLRKRLGEEAREEIRRRFQLKDTARRVEKLYLEQLNLL